MRRDDTTTPEYQRAYRGRHQLGNGRDGYGNRPPLRYYRCGCGWRVRGVRETRGAKAEVLDAWTAHLLEVTGEG